MIILKEITKKYKHNNEEIIALSMINLEIKPNTTYDVRSAQIFIKDKNIVFLKKNFDN